MIYYGQPSPWAERVEDAIIEAVARLKDAVRSPISRVPSR
jgi:hypothetical protein